MFPSQVHTNGHTNFMNEFFLGYQEFVTSLINDNVKFMNQNLNESIHKVGWPNDKKITQLHQFK